VEVEAVEFSRFRFHRRRTASSFRFHIPDCNTFAASAELAYAQPSQDAPKNMRDQPIDVQFLRTFWNID